MFHPKGPTLRELVVQGLSSTDRGYDLLAPKFEFTPFRTPEPVLRVALQQLEAPVERALDLACGTGAAIRSLLTLTRGPIVGLDRSEGMLAEARRLTNDPSRVHLVRGDALQAPFREAFDLVTCFGAFGHVRVKDEPAFVRAVRRLLVPGGRFVFVTSDRISALHPAWWMARGFNAAMRIRNALRKPEFVMYYLTFLLPRARALLEAEGFAVDVRRRIFPSPFQRLIAVIATKSDAGA